MRYLITLLLLAALSFNVGPARAEDTIQYQFASLGNPGGQACASPACGTPYCQPECYCPTWTVRAGTMYLNRERPRSQTLVTDAGSNDVMNMREFDFKFEPGITLQAIRQTRYGWDVEIDFSMVDWWESSRTVTGTDMEATGGWGANGFGGGREVVGRYGSSLYNTEINFRRQTQGAITPFVGFRWIELHEDFTLDMTQVGGLYSPGIVTATNTDNHMYGMQLGADMLVLDRGRFQIETLVKAGIFGNLTDQYSYSTNDGIGVVATAGSRKSHTAFAGDLKFTGHFQATECMAIRAGYQLLWIEGVALAPEQFDNTDLTGGTATVDVGGSPFYHGAFVALEITH